jgi:DNA recombination protein RmuC
MTQNLIWIGLIAVTAFALTVAVCWLASTRASSSAYARGRREAELEAAPLRERAEDLTTRLTAAETRLENAQQTFRDMQSQKGALESTAARVPVLEKEIESLRTRAEALAREVAESGNRNAEIEATLRELRSHEPKMKELLAAFLQEKGESLTKHNSENLRAILDPLNTRIQEFKTQIETSHKEGRDQHVQLKTQIEGLLGMNQRLSAEAQSLTQALKGENKTGGNWGELVLERVLESSGLSKDREYRIQPSYAGDEGRQQPDVVIDLPDNRHLVVDSKLSLVAYKRYVEASDAAIAEVELDAHVKSIRSHIEQLSAKKYQDIHALNSVDFVFLFMPVEPAFIEASKRDPSLFETAFAKNIVIVSPSTLLATLRTVASIWKQEHQNRNVREIARQATALHDKFVGFIVDLEKVGKSLGAAQESFAEAKSKLSQGKGNLVARVENITKLGAKSGKLIPASWREPDAETEGPDDDAPALSLDEPRE